MVSNDLSGYSFLVESRYWRHIRVEEIGKRLDYLGNGPGASWGDLFGRELVSSSKS